MNLDIKHKYENGEYKYTSVHLDLGYEFTISETVISSKGEPKETLGFDLNKSTEAFKFYAVIEELAKYSIIENDSEVFEALNNGNRVAYLYNVLTGKS